MDYSKTPQKHITNQKPIKVFGKLKKNWLAKMQDLYVSTSEEII